MTDVTRRAAQARIEMDETETAFTALRAAMLEEIATSSLAHQDKRERLYLGIQALDGVRKALRQLVDAGLVENTLTAARAAMAEQTTFLRP